MTRTTLGIDGISFEVDVEPGRILVDGAETAPPRRAQAVASGDTRWVFLDGEVYEFEVQRPGRRGASSHHASLSAPMPATVRRVSVVPGDRVSKGDTLLVLEAMKMELPVRAPQDGVVTTVSCKEGDLVQPGVPLLEIE